jgi:flagellar motor component MotA
MNIRQVTAITLFTTLFVAVIVAGNYPPIIGLGAFIDGPSLIFVVGVLVSCTLWAFSLKDIQSAFTNALFESEPTEQEILKSSHILEEMSEYAVAAGLIGTLIGVIKMLGNMDDPIAIAPSMAIGLLTLFYGIVLSQFVFRSMRNSLLQKSPVLLQRTSKRGLSTLSYTLFGLFVVIMVFTVMLGTSL